LAGRGARSTIVGPDAYCYLAPISSIAAARNIEAFRAGLRDLGYVEGRDITLELRFAEGAIERLPVLAAELVALKPAVIVAGSPPAAPAARQATSAIPIVMNSSPNPLAPGIGQKPCAARRQCHRILVGGRRFDRQAARIAQGGTRENTEDEIVPDLVLREGRHVEGHEISKEHSMELASAGRRRKLRFVRRLGLSGPVAFTSRAGLLLPSKADAENRLQLLEFLGILVRRLLNGRS
jgi:hypothetical protein